MVTTDATEMHLLMPLELSTPLTRPVTVSGSVMLFDTSYEGCH